MKAEGFNDNALGNVHKPHQKGRDCTNVSINSHIASSDRSFITRRFNANLREVQNKLKILSWEWLILFLQALGALSLVSNISKLMSQYNISSISHEKAVSSPNLQTIYYYKLDKKIKKKIFIWYRLLTMHNAQISIGQETGCFLLCYLVIFRGINNR